MKTKIITLILAALSFGLVGCGTPAQNVASVNYLAGRAFATYELQKSPATGASLTNLVAALKVVTSSSTAPTPFEMGVLSGQVQELKAAGAATANSTITAIGSTIDGLVQVGASTSGGNPTVVTAAISADLQDFLNGVNDENLFLQGQQSVLIPSAPGPIHTQ